MTLESIITTYGYFGLFIGTFLEGETILVLAGFLAHRGYLHLQWVIFFAFLGTLAGDQTFFILGRFKGKDYLLKKPAWQARAQKASDLLVRYRLPVLLGFRFLYGLRSVTPFVIGLTRIKAGYFVLLNALGAAVWATLVASGGYFFGTALEALLVDIKRYELAAMLGIGVVGLSAWLVRFRRRKKANGSSR